MEIAKHQTRDKILFSIEISKRSGVPVLFISNPGNIKTHTVEAYARRKGYNFVKIIGSHLAPEEVAGMQVRKNNSDEIFFAPAYWYKDVVEKDKQGIPTLLFIDELTGAQQFTQAAMLNLCKEREIGGMMKLPESTFIVSACNYKNNLPDEMELLSPEINRFMVVNLNDDNDHGQEYLEEASCEEEDWNADIFDPEFNNKIDPKIMSIQYRTMWDTIFKKYLNKEDGINLANTEYKDLFSKQADYLKNFLSKRSFHYLKKVLKAYCESNYNQPVFLYEAAFGLVGAGTCTFKNKDTQSMYLQDLQNQIRNVVTTVRKNEVKAAALSPIIDVDNLPLPEAIAQVQLQLSTAPQDLFNKDKLDERIRKEYNENVHSTLTKKKNELLELHSELQAINEYDKDILDKKWKFYFDRLDSIVLSNKPITIQDGDSFLSIKNNQIMWVTYKDRKCVKEDGTELAKADYPISVLFVDVKEPNVPKLVVEKLQYKDL